MAEEPQQPKEPSPWVAFWIALLICAALVAALILIMPYPAINALLIGQEAQTAEKSIVAGCVSTACVVGNWLELHNGVIAALAAVALVAVTISLRQATDRLVEVGKRQIEEAKRLAKIGEQQTSILGAQADIALRHQQIARLQFAAAHRPKLAFRSIALGDFEIGKPITMSVILSNAGSSSATVKDGNATILVAREGRLPDLPEYDQDRMFMANPVLKVGRRNSFVKLTDWNLVAWQYDCIYPPLGHITNAKLYFFGFIVYEDEMGNSRSLGFCRQFNTNTRRFEVVNDPNYEYED